MSLATLSSAEVLTIYESLFLDSAIDGEPMSPYGVKSQNLLESAISRQHTGFNGRLKYESAYSNAASLCYGICSNHPFHNGNKRTALVAMLCHLDRNERVFSEQVSQDDLYAVMVRLASHRLSDYKRRASSDEEVDALAKWIRSNVRRVENGERVITCRQLRTILTKYGFELENHDGNHIDVVRYSQSSIFGIKGAKRRTRVMRIPYPMDGAQVGRSVLRELRQRCELTNADGIDSSMFYSSTRPANYFIAKYSKTLRRLAKT